MPRFASLAEKYRWHRRAMERALAQGITPREAEIQLINEDSEARIADIRRHRTIQSTAPAETTSSKRFWWQEQDR